MPKISDYQTFCAHLLDSNIEADVLEGGWYTRYMLRNFYPKGVVQSGGGNPYSQKKTWAGDPYTAIRRATRAMGVSLAGFPKEVIAELRTLQDLYHENTLPAGRIDSDCDPMVQESASHSSSESDAGDSATRRADTRQVASHQAVLSGTRETPSVKSRSTEATTGNAPVQETQQSLDEYANSSEFDDRLPVVAGQTGPPADTLLAYEGASYQSSTSSVGDQGNDDKPSKAATAATEDSDLAAAPSATPRQTYISPPAFEQLLRAEDEHRSFEPSGPISSHCQQQHLHPSGDYQLVASKIGPTYIGGSSLRAMFGQIKSAQWRYGPDKASQDAIEDAIYGNELSLMISEECKGGRRTRPDR